MSDRYQSFSSSPIGQVFVKNLGLPSPQKLERYTAGAPLVDGTVVTGGTGRIDVTGALDGLGISNTPKAEEGEKYKGLVFDATGITSPEGLVALQEFFTPLLRSLKACARVVVIGTNPTQTDSTDERIAQRALEGFTRSLGKEIGKGSTVNLVYVAPGAEATVESTLAFFLSPKSAYVSGQVVRVGATGITTAPDVTDLAKPLAGKVALVTGASRGLGLADMETLARDGATVIGLDVPPLEDDLKKAVERLGGGYVVGDITAPDAPQLIGDYIKKNHGKVDIVVHNAGITRDKMLRNMKPENWQLVVEISVGAPQRITDHLLENDLISDGGRVIGIASVAGIAGNRGQTNYASAKAGVIGWIQSLAKRVADKGITANVIAPGFMETEMVKTIPLGIREAGRRMNSMSQGGQPVDVAEAITWLASPGSQAVSGNVIGVNGQMLLGAS